MHHSNAVVHITDYRISWLLSAFHCTLILILWYRKTSVNFTFTCSTEEEEEQQQQQQQQTNKQTNKSYFPQYMYTYIHICDICSG